MKHDGLLLLEKARCTQQDGDQEGHQAMRIAQVKSSCSSNVAILNDVLPPLI